MPQDAPVRVVHAPVSRRRRSYRDRVTSGRILAQGLGVYTRNFVAFTLVTALVYAPLVALQLLQATGAWEERFDDLKLQIALGLLDEGLPYLLVGALAYGVFQELRGRRASIAACIHVGFARLFAVLGVALLVGLLLGGLFAAAYALAFAQILFGMVALIVVAIVAVVLTCRYFVAVPAAVVEEVGPAAALGRSTVLTQGRRWSIFGTVFSLGLLQGFVAFVVAFLGPDGGYHGSAAVLVQVPGILFFGAWYATCATVAYAGLRREKEGVDDEELAAVFE